MRNVSFFMALLLALSGESLASPAATADPSPTDAKASKAQEVTVPSTPPTTPETASLNWQGEAKLRGALSGTPGLLVVDGNQVQFRPTKGETQRWPVTEIETLDLNSQRVLLTGYERRGRLRLGTRRFRFDLGTAMPAYVAAAVVARVGKPSRNRNVDPQASAFATIPAHHCTPRGGSNGILRLREGGIDYVTGWSNDSRSWRWADIDTLSNLDPYHLVLSGYLETYSFDLKQPMTRAVFGRISDEVYARRTANLRSGGRIEP